MAKTGSVQPGSYDLKLKHLSNKLHQEVWGEPLDEHFQDPKEYTGLYMTGFIHFPTVSLTDFVVEKTLCAHVHNHQVLRNSYMY